MSVDGVLLTDVRRVVKEKPLSFFFLVTGPVGHGRSFALRSIVSAAPRTLTVGELRSASPPSGGGPVGDFPVRIAVLEYGTLGDLTDLTSASSNAALFPAGSVVVIDDVELLWTVSVMEGKLHVLKAFLSLLLRSPRCALVSSAVSVNHVPLFVRSLRAPLVYEVPPLTEPRARRVCRAYRDFQPLDDVAPASIPLECTTRTFLTNLCMLKSEQCPAESVASSTVANCAWLSGAAPLETKRSARLCGLSHIRERLSMLISVFTSTTSGGSLLASLSPTTGILLHGPSGCGKSALARELAVVHTSVHFVFVNCTSLFSKYLGESEEKLRAVYRKARSRSPAVVVLDDVDVIGQSRGKFGAHGGGGSGGGGADVHRRMLAGLLCELDGVVDNSGVLTIGTTNMPGVLDAALLRQGRLETLVLVPPLTRDAAREMAHAFFIDFKGPEAEKAALAGLVAERSVGCTPIALKHVLRLLLEKSLEGATADGSADVSLPLPNVEVVHGALFAHASLLMRVPYHFDE